MTDGQADCQSGRDMLGFVIKRMLQFLQFYSDANQIYVGESRYDCTYEGVFILILCYTYNPFKQWCSYGVIGTFLTKL